jgi:hypothetical protein
MNIKFEMETEEWPGKTSQKFTTCRKHVQPAPQDENRQNPLFAMPSKKHIQPKPSEEF